MDDISLTSASTSSPAYVPPSDCFVRNFCLNVQVARKHGSSLPATRFLPFTPVPFLLPTPDAAKGQWRPRGTAVCIRNVLGKGVRGCALPPSWCVSCAMWRHLNSSDLRPGRVLTEIVVRIVALSRAVRAYNLTSRFSRRMSYLMTQISTWALWTLFPVRITIPRVHSRELMSCA